MSIKRFIKNKTKSVKLKLQSGVAIVLFSLEDETTECVYIQNSTDAELEKLRDLFSVENYRFVGDQNILNSIKSLNFSWGEKCIKEIFLDQVAEAIFYSETGKVKISKHNESKNIKKKVLIVDDSKTIQKILSNIISKSDTLEVMGIADRPSAAKAIIDQERPDLITLDIHMPEMNGVDFLKTYLQQKNIPTVMISSVSINEGPLVLDALSHGALTYIQKPSFEEMNSTSSDILDTLESVSTYRHEIDKKLFSKLKITFDNYDNLIVIGSSTGGPPALKTILTSMPERIPPIFIVQHIPAVFSKALSDSLNKVCPFHVKEAVDGETVESNTVYIAPGGLQIELKRSGGKLKVSTNDNEPVNRFKPSVDYFFNSCSELKNEQMVGVILTGMGKDGAKGLLNLKNSGALTIAQDEKSCVVFGMPKEAIKLNAADEIVSLDDIAESIVLLHNKLNKSQAA